MKTKKYYNREISWLAFNHRVLQEAADTTVPLFERIKFLAIFSSNLDEFFRVRVATIRSVQNSLKKDDSELNRLLKDICKIVNEHQCEYGRIISEIFAELKKHKICLLDSKNVPVTHLSFIEDYFNRIIRPLIQPILIVRNKLNIFLKNKSIYLSIRLISNNSSNKSESNRNKKISRYAIVEIPSDQLARFVILPEIDGNKYVMFLDDVIKLNLNVLFPGYEVAECYSIKMTRDAELYIDDEFSGDLLEKIKKSLAKRNTGLPSRFLYDSNMPKYFLRVLKKSLNLKKEYLISGGKYHNLNDYFSFPTFGLNNLEYEKPAPILCRDFENAEKMIDVLNRKDVLLYYPYHSYQYVIRLLEESAVDTQVKSIKITLYRTSSNSRIIKALTDAAKNGKSVTAFVEVKARFDEDSNFKNAEELEKAGVKVLYSFPGLKVHCKICLINRIENNEKKFYTYLSTGNFNEKTACIYSDFGFFTSNDLIISELKNVFKFLYEKNEKPKFNNLLTAPFNFRKSFEELIENEIQTALKGKKASIVLKLNSLEDKKMIGKLYLASKAGVEIIIIVRGTCCLIPGIKGLSENIKVISIIDRYLEHSRLYLFNNKGDEKIYLSSADLMTRNINRRVEIAFPIYDKILKEKLKKLIEIQIKDNVKARVINKNQNNSFVKSNSSQKIRSQFAINDILSNEFSNT